MSLLYQGRKVLENQKHCLEFEEVCAVCLLWLCLSAACHPSSSDRMAQRMRESSTTPGYTILRKGWGMLFFQLTEGWNIAHTCALAMTWGCLNKNRPTCLCLWVVATLLAHTCWRCGELASNLMGASCICRPPLERWNTETSCVRSLSSPPWSNNRTACKECYCYIDITRDAYKITSKVSAD